MEETISEDKKRELMEKANKIPFFWKALREEIERQLSEEKLSNKI
jgi:hypothetical protein